MLIIPFTIDRFTLRLTRYKDYHIHIYESRRDGMFIAKVYTPIIESHRDGMFIQYLLK